MKTNKATPSQNIHHEHLETINGVRFTPREIDIIACLLSGKGTKTVAQFLSIEEKTVETHKYNIMRKLECNSKESIIDFTEKSDKFSIVKKHYLRLLVQATFEKHLREILTLRGKIISVCCLIYWREQETASLINWIERHLKLAGIKILSEVRENYKSINHLVHHIETQSVEYILYIPSQILMTQLQLEDSKEKSEIFPFTQKSFKNPGSVIFLLQDKDSFAGIPQDIQDVGYVNFGRLENYYFSLLDILQRVLPIINLEKTISGFKKQYEGIFGSTDRTLPQLWSQVNEIQEKGNSAGSILTTSLPKGRIHLFVGGAMLLGILCTLLLVSNSSKIDEKIHNANSQSSQSIRSDLIVPTGSSFLNRPNLMVKMEKMLSGNGIQTVALTGIGGIGKTTIARQYGREHNAGIVWEINAETKRSLAYSFETFAYALSQSEEEKKILRELQDIKNQEEKEEKIILFIKSKLKPITGWILIYDNVDKFSDIQKFFPSDPNVWGKGQVIITTRDVHIQNNNLVNHTIKVSELDAEEKLALFAKIMNYSDHNLQLLKESRTFLEEIPPFPLDVSIAAYYLKATKISPHNYLKNLDQYNKDFTSTQENLLRSAGDYVKTRYNIIGVSLNHIINLNKDFKKFLLFVSLIDSQKIPRELLDVYKNNSIVDNFIYQLKKYSLITDDPSISTPDSIPTFSIHRSTQKIILNYLTKALNLKAGDPLLQTIFKDLEHYMDEAIGKENSLKKGLSIPHGERFLSHHHLLTNGIKGSVGSKLGFLYTDLANYDKAKILLEDSLIKLNKYDSYNYKNISQNLSYLGYVQRYCGNYKESIGLLKESLRILKKYSPKNHTQIIWSLAQLGLSYRHMGEYLKATDSLEESISIHKSENLKDYLNLSRSLRYLGTVHRELGNYEKAKELFEESLMICKEYIPNKSMEMAWSLVNLGTVYGEINSDNKSQDFLDPPKIYKIYPPINETGLNNFKKGKELIEQGLAIYKKKFSENYFGIFNIQLLLGNAFKNIGDYKKAREILEKTLFIYEKNYGKNHTETAKALKSLGDVIYLEGHLEEAENLIKKALLIFQQHTHPNAYTCFESLSELYLCKSFEAKNRNDNHQFTNFKKQSIHCLEQALKIIKNGSLLSSPHMIRIKNKIKKVNDLHFS